MCFGVFLKILDANTETWFSFSFTFFMNTYIKVKMPTTLLKALGKKAELFFCEISITLPNVPYLHKEIKDLPDTLLFFIEKFQ